jgi:peptidyl-tRNA hydrolase, PTH1 family
LDASEQIPEQNVRSGEERHGVFLVVGLGNPGIEYQFTPHNAGFLAIDRLAEQYSAVVGNRRCKALTATIRIAGREVILAKPETWMNLSGMAVKALVEEYGADPAKDLVILHDELDLPLGALKIRERGRDAGHNGVRSIINILGSQEWTRVRIGVGPELLSATERPGAAARRGGKDYLLTPLRKKDLAVLDEVLDRAADAVRCIIEQGTSAAMNEFNRRERNGPAE